MCGMESKHRSSIRLSPEIWKAIDLLREQLPGKVSRNTWIALAVQEKVDRDNDKRATAVRGDKNA